MSRRAACLALLGGLCLTAGLFASGRPESSARSVLDTGHVGAVRSLTFDARSGCLLSGGEDGTVRIWDAAAHSIVLTLKVTQLAITRIAANPVSPQVAVVVTDGTGSFHLSVWDWVAERELYRVPLRESPLFLRYSASGNYLLYGVSSWQGLAILHAKDGAPLEFHPEGFGIVGFAEMSRSDRTLMTYSLSGRITYWDVTTGQQAVDVPAVPYLSLLAISADRRFVAGSTGSEVDILDAVTGAMKCRVPVSGAVSLDFSPAGDEISCLAMPGSTITRWSFAGPVAALSATVPGIGATPRLLSWGSSSLFAATAEGMLAAIPSTGQPVLFGGNALARLTGISAAAGAVALGSPEWVRVFASDMLTAAVSPSFISTRLRPNPFGAPVGLGFLDDGRLLAWRADTVAPGVSVATADGPFTVLPAGFRGPTLALRAAGSALVGIETGGTVRIVDMATGLSRFELRVPGVSAAVQTGPTEIIAARNSSSSSAGSLLRVNVETGETVAVKDRNVYTWGVSLDRPDPDGAQVLYSVGVDASGSTNLFMHDGPGFEHETLLDSVAAEDLDAGFSIDPTSHALYAIVGRDRVVRWDGKQAAVLALEGAAPMRLVARDNLLFVLNRDGTVTVSAAATGARLGEIALFADGEWAILLRDGRYAASTGGDLHVRVFVAGAPLKTTEDYRLRIPIQ
jgi:hypothetical protein